MRRNVLLKEDLRYIPRGAKGTPQNMFRQCYCMCFSLQQARSRSLALALALAESSYPGCTLQYDLAHFGLE